MEIANSLEPYMDGRILTELLNGPMLYQFKATRAEYSAGIKHAIHCGWLTMHESGTHFKFTQAGKDLFA